MALDRNGNTIATGQVYLLAGTVRRVDDDQVWVVLGERGDSVVRVKAGDVVKVDDTGGPGGGVSDHGDLTGLADDDHPQYMRADGTRAFTAPVSGSDPSIASHLATANWVNAQFASTFLTLLGTFQGLDPQLTALAALSPSADQGIYWTSATAAATFSLTSFGRTLAGSADAAAARSTLGVVIGTNVQAYDAELQALAGLVSAADRLPYFTGSGTAALATFTAFGRSLVDDANAAAARTTLGAAASGAVTASGLTASATDRLIGRSSAGAGALQEITCTAFARTLIDDADASTARTTMGAAASGAVTASGLTASATDVIVGRSSAGAGALQEIACTAAGRQMIALAPVTAGSMAIYDGTSWTLLGPGDEGQVLMMVGGAPKWTDLP